MTASIVPFPEPSSRSRAVAPKTVERILRAGAMLWCSTGALPSFAEVADLVGITPPTVRRAFATPDDLVDEIASIEFNVLMDIVDEHMPAGVERGRRAFFDALDEVSHALVSHGAELSRKERVMARLPMLSLLRVQPFGSPQLEPQVVVTIHAMSALAVCWGPDWGMARAVLRGLHPPPLPKPWPDDPWADPNATDDDDDRHSPVIPARPVLPRPRGRTVTSPFS